MTRSRTSAKAAVFCDACGESRYLLHPKLAGRMCRTCAALVGSAAAAVAGPSPAERFMAQVRRSESGCWDWIGTKQVNGYSSFFNDGRTVRGHRWSYEHHVGPIADGLQIDHLCRNRACVNPAHLEPVTARENSRRAMRTHCVNGHEFNELNTYRPAGGKRYCRECRRQRVRNRRAS